jgi:hypothetical protein
MSRRRSYRGRPGAVTITRIRLFRLFWPHRASGRRESGAWMGFRTPLGLHRQSGIYRPIEDMIPIDTALPRL